MTWGEAILLKEVRNVSSFFRDKVEGEKEKREFVFHTSLRCLLDIWMVMMKKQPAVCLEISKLKHKLQSLLVKREHESPWYW